MHNENQTCQFLCWLLQACWVTFFFRNNHFKLSSISSYLATGTMSVPPLLPFVSSFLWTFLFLSQALRPLKIQYPRKPLQAGISFICLLGDSYCFSCLVPLGNFTGSHLYSQVKRCSLHSLMKMPPTSNRIISWTMLCFINSDGNNLTPKLSHKKRTA